MTKMLFLADLHAHNYEQFHTRLPNGRNSRLQDCLNILAQAKEAAIEHSISQIWILGDLFHARTKLDVDVFTSTWLAVRDLADSRYVHILRGNHDSYSKIGEVHSLEAFKEIPNCTVIDKPVMMRDGCHLFAYPYSPDSGQYVKQWNDPAFEANNCKFDLLLLHQSIREAAIGPYVMTGHGELSVNDLPMNSCKYVFAGDYHKRQWFGPGNRVHYVGSPLQLNFGERNETKAFTMIDTKTWEVTEIPTKAPKFHQFETPGEFNAALSAGIVRPDIDFVRILTTNAHGSEAVDVKTAFDRVQIVEQKADLSALRRVGQEVVGNDMALLEAYVAQKAGTFDVDRLLSIGLEELVGECVA